MQREYNIDLRDALWGTEWRAPSKSHGWVGVRRLRALIDGLPVDGAFARSVDPKMVSWLQSSPELLAVTAELLDARMHQASGLKKHELPERLKIPRPWEAQIEQATGSDLAMFIKRIGASG